MNPPFLSDTTPQRTSRPGRPQPAPAPAVGETLAAVRRPEGARPFRPLLSFLVLPGLLLLAGCGHHESDDPVVATTPAEAATGLEASFESAPDSVRENVRLASEAMRKAQYEQAILSLGAVREQASMTLDQGMAIHGAVVSMESDLIAAMQAGDPNAKRAYELLRAMKRN